MGADQPSTEGKLFKDWFDRAAARALGAQFAAAWSDFDETRFVRSAMRGLGELELSGRVKQFSDALAANLPGAVPEALSVLVKSLPEPQSDCETVSEGWLQWPLGQFIADHGVGHFEESMAAMVELTKRFSAEFAVRPFVEQHPEATFARLLSLTGDPNPHVRRWCSEGVRPLLPWGRKLRALVADPSPLWPILEALKDDRELFVRRSVANVVNDIAKNQPALAVARCQAWSKRSNPRRDWLIKHGLRSLVKDGNPGALAVIGFGPPRKLSVTLKATPKSVAVGGVVELCAEIETGAASAQRLVVDYAVHYVRKAGTTSAKVFKWTTLELGGREGRQLSKRHPMKATTIRALYPGVHRVELQVNGVRLAEASFRLS